MNAMEAILHASPVVQLTLFILVLLSILCWAVGFAKFRQFKALENANAPFMNRFWKTTSFDRLYEDIENYKGSNIARVFKEAYHELQRMAGPQESASPTLLRGIDNLERTLRKAMDAEVAEMESRLTILATTGSTGPFIGLFGTVWGIMTSFHKIGVTGSASLAVVAPGISEALIATAIGLAAAIPAVMLYNQFLSKIKKMEMDMNSFCTDFLNIAKIHFFKE